MATEAKRGGHYVKDANTTIPVTQICAVALQKVAVYFAADPQQVAARTQILQAIPANAYFFAKKGWGYCSQGHYDLSTRHGPIQSSTDSENPGMCRQAGCGQTCGSISLCGETNLAWATFYHPSSHINKCQCCQSIWKEIENPQQQQAAPVAAAAVVTPSPTHSNVPNVADQNDDSDDDVSMGAPYSPDYAGAAEDFSEQHQLQSPPAMPLKEYRNTATEEVFAIVKTPDESVIRTPYLDSLMHLLQQHQQLKQENDVLNQSMGLCHAQHQHELQEAARLIASKDAIEQSLRAANAELLARLNQKIEAQGRRGKIILKHVREHQNVAAVDLCLEFEDIPDLTAATFQLCLLRGGTERFSTWAMAPDNSLRFLVASCPPNQELIAQLKLLSGVPYDIVNSNDTCWHCNAALCDFCDALHPLQFTRITGDAFPQNQKSSTNTNSGGGYDGHGGGDNFDFQFGGGSSPSGSGGSHGTGGHFYSPSGYGNYGYQFSLKDKDLDSSLFDGFDEKRRAFRDVGHDAELLVDYLALVSQALEKFPASHSNMQNQFLKIGAAMYDFTDQFGKNLLTHLALREPLRPLLDLCFTAEQIESMRQVKDIKHGRTAEDWLDFYGFDWKPIVAPQAPAPSSVSAEVTEEADDDDDIVSTITASSTLSKNTMATDVSDGISVVSMSSVKTTAMSIASSDDMSVTSASSVSTISSPGKKKQAVSGSKIPKVRDQYTYSCPGWDPQNHPEFKETIAACDSTTDDLDTSDRRCKKCRQKLVLECNTCHRLGYGNISSHQCSRKKSTPTASPAGSPLSAAKTGKVQSKPHL